MMHMHEAVMTRRSIRSFKDSKIPEDLRKALDDEISECNREGGVSLQLITDNPGICDSFLGRSHRNVRNCVALVGPSGREADVAYYGARVMMLAQRLGLSSCWIALSFSKRKCGCSVGKGERQFGIITLGYADEDGKERSTKTVEELSETDVPMPEWFARGMEYAQRAPTAMNRQRFRISLKDGKVSIDSSGMCADSNEGIVRYFFELGAGAAAFEWA